MVVALRPHAVVLAPLVVPAAAVATVVAILSGEVAVSEETPFFGAMSWALFAEEASTPTLAAGEVFQVFAWGPTEMTSAFSFVCALLRVE
jgi:hypothetical protein